MRLLACLLSLTLAAGCGGGDKTKKNTNVENLDDGDLDNDGIKDSEEETPVAPKAPTGLAATPAVQGATLTWNAADAATKYILLRSATSGAGYAQVYAGAAQTYFDGGLTAGVTYYYVVQAENDVGKSPNSSEASAKALYPVAPAPATVAVVQGDAQLRIYWSTSAGAANYVLQRQTEGGAYVNVATGTTLTNYIDTSVVNGYRYGYRIQVVNPDGALSSSTTATEAPFHPGRQYCVPSQDGIHLFSAEADFAATPVRTIAAPRMFTNPTDMAVTAATNRIYVLDTLAGSVAVYDMAKFANNPITTPALRTISAVGGLAVAASGSEVFLLVPGAIRVYDGSGTQVRSGTDARLLTAVDMAIGGGEIITVHAGGTLNRWTLNPIAHVATITDSNYLLATPLAIEYVDFNDRVAVLDGNGVVRMYARNSSGAQVAAAAKATGFSDAKDIGYDSISRQVWVMRDPGGISNTYAYDATALTQKRYFDVADASPRSLLEIDGANGQFYAISGNNTIGKYGNYSGLTTLGQKSADKRMVATLTGMIDPQNFTVDTVNQQLYVRNKNRFLTIHSLAEGASSQNLGYTFYSVYGFNGDVVVYPAQSRMYVGETSHITKLAIPFSATVVTASTINQSYSGLYQNSSLSTVDNRIYAFDADPDSWFELHIRGLQAVSDIRYNMAIYNMAPTTSTGTNVAYANFPGGGEVIAIDPANKFGWVFTPSLTVKRTFTLSGATSTWVSLVADPVNQEIYVLRDGVVDVYNRNALKGNNVAPVRSATLIATGGVNTAKDIELCK